MAEQHDLIDANTGQKFSSLDLLVGGGGGGAVNSVNAGTGISITGPASDPIVNLDAASIASLALANTAVQPARTLTAGAGLTGGGDLSADRTFNVAAGDASITVNADSIEASGNFVAKDLVTTGTLTLGTNPAAAGIVRLPNNQLISWRNAANSADAAQLSCNGSNVMTLTATGGISASNGFSCASTATFNSTVIFNTAAITIAAAVVNPTLSQTVDSAATTTGDPLTIAAQDCSGTTAVTAGILRLRAGNATGGAGTRNGGSVELLVGTGATSVGNISLGLAAANFQSMQRGIFVSDSAAVPTGNPAAGGFLYSEAGALKWRGSAGNTTTIAIA